MYQSLQYSRVTQFYTYIYIYIYIFKYLSQEIGCSCSLCYTVGPCWLSILNVVCVCVCVCVYVCVLVMS